MCTVTFLNKGNQYIFAANRDESTKRKKASPPKIIHKNGTKILCPIDQAKGGTWLGINQYGVIVILLNGGFINHKHQPPYRESRGIILLDILSHKGIIDRFNSIDLNGIEPFTLVVLEDGIIIECRWDEKMKHINIPKDQNSGIWSSATLYSEKIIKERESSFKNWLAENPDAELKDLILFHTFGGVGDKKNDFVMERGNYLKTLSITCMQWTPQKAEMHYFDIDDQQRFKEDIEFTSAITL